MKTEDFNYDLPEECIAQAPAEPRDSCKLLVLNRKTQSMEHKRFFEIANYLEPGDLLVVNNTRVLPARLRGFKEHSGGAAELLLLTKREDIDPLGYVWECLVKPGRRLKEGNVIEFFDKDKHDEDAQVVLRAHIIDRIETQGGRLVRFEKSQEHMSLDEALHLVGSIPLPPYIQNYQGDTELYQTVYAMDDEHSAAAPTAGLHFTDELIEKLKAQGIKFASVELEVGIDTFRIISEENAEDHQMHTERYHVSQELVDLIEETKAAGKRVIAVGTTSVRSLESAWDSEQGRLVAKENATTDLYLMPGSSFHVVDALITNFHVPKSSLMILVSAFADRDQIMKAYETAKQEHYRFLSFGDAMFII